MAIVWGSVFVGIKIGLEYFPPFLYAAGRFYISAIALFAHSFLTADRIRPNNSAEWTDILASGLLIFGTFQGLLFFGEQFTTSAIAAIIVSMNSIIITGLSRLVLPDERLSLLGILGLLAGFVGVGIVTRPNPELLLSGALLGEIVILVGVFAFGIGNIITRVVEEDVVLPVTVRLGWSMGIGAIVLHLTSISLGESPLAVQITLESVGALLYIALVPSVIGYSIFFELLDRIGPIEVNLVTYVTPITAGIIGWILLDERLQLLTIAGFLVIFLGFVMIKAEELSEHLVPNDHST